MPGTHLCTPPCPANSNNKLAPEPAGLKAASAPELGGMYGMDLLPGDGI